MKHLFYILVFSLCIFSCQNQETVSGQNDLNPAAESEFTASDIQEAAELYMSIDDYLALSEEERYIRRCSIIMTGYITTDKEKRVYTIDISEDQALELGVSREQYRRCCKETEDINKFLQEHKDIELLEIKAGRQEHLEELRNGTVVETVVLKRRDNKGF